MMINVLNKGFVRLIDSMGGDLRIINAARASFKKESFEWSMADEKLLSYLWNKKELAVFRHCVVTFEIKAPLEICRQWWKYHIASNHTTDQDGWSEQSKRYVTSEVEFYIPTNEQWREAPLSKKQGSGEQLDPRVGSWLTEQLQIQSLKGKELFQEALDFGLCAEQARLFLNSNAQYTSWYWTTSLAALLHFLEERLGHGAQKEMQQYAQAVLDLTAPLFPATFKLLDLGE